MWISWTLGLSIAQTSTNKQVFRLDSPTLMGILFEASKREAREATNKSDAPCSTSVFKSDGGAGTKNYFLAIFFGGGVIFWEGHEAENTYTLCRKMIFFAKPQDLYGNTFNFQLYSLKSFSILRRYVIDGVVNHSAIGVCHCGTQQSSKTTIYYRYLLKTTTIRPL